MFRKYMIFILAAFMIVGTSACTSRKASDDSADVEQSSGDESIDAADAGAGNSDGLSTDDSGAVADLGGANDDLAPEEKLPDDKAAPPADATASTDQTLPPADATGDVPPPAPDQAAAEPAPPPEPGAGADAAAPPPVAAEPAPPAEPMAPPVAEPAVPAETKPVATLQKMKQTPWKQGKTLVNALYIARKGDSPESISQKVFGTKDKVKDLCKVNSYNCSRTVKVGDKFYYNSPQRPTDDQTVKTFYEDAGIQPQIYTSKPGDNIRKVGKELLGHERSWQELWATNDVESKGDLDEGTKLRYWPDTEGAPAQTMAKTDDAAPAPPAGEATPGEAADGAPDQAANTPPPPPPPAADNAQAAATPPPPPPPADALPPAPPDQAQQAAAAQVAAEPPPPPPPPPAEQAKHGEPAAIDAGQDPNQTMALGVGAVLLLAAAALFISIRKKRARRQIDFNTTTQTQIE